MQLINIFKLNVNQSWLQIVKNRLKTFLNFYLLLKNKNKKLEEHKTNKKSKYLNCWQRIIIKAEKQILLIGYLVAAAAAACSNLRFLYYNNDDDDAQKRYDCAHQM